MSNWVDNALDLANFPKNDLIAPPITNLDKEVTAADMNAIRQALLDIQTFLRGAFKVFKASDATKFAHVDVVITSPNGTLAAAKGAIVIDIVAAKIWINTDGATTWQDVTAAGGGGGGITNSAGANVIMKSNGANAVASGLSDDGTTVTTTGNRVLQVAASALTDAYPLYIKGPIQVPFTVTDNQNGEIFQMTLVQANRVGLGGNSDCFGVVIRNEVNYDNTSHTNACGGGYFEASGARTTGLQALTNMAVEGSAFNGDINYAFVSFAGKGLARFDDGCLAGPSSVTGAFTQTAGNVALLSGTSTCTINGATHITGTNPNLSVDGTSLLSGNATLNGTIRVNGANSNLAGGAGLVFLQSINSSGVPVPVSNAFGYAAGRYSASTAADPTLGWAIATGVATNLTLAAGTKDGQEWALSVESGSGQVTPSTLNGGTKYTWTGIAGLILRWNNTLSKWSMVSQTGMTLV